MPEAADDLKVISVKLDQIKEDQGETNLKVSEIKEGLYNPEKGVYAQVTDIKRKSQEYEKYVQEMRKDVHKLNEKVGPLGERTALMERWTEEHEASDKQMRRIQTELAESLKTGIGGMTESMKPLHDDFKIRQSRKKWTDRIFATILTLLITGLSGMVWKTFTNQDKVEVLEKKIIEERQHPNESMDRLLRKLERMERMEEVRRKNLAPPVIAPPAETDPPSVSVPSPTLEAQPDNVPPSVIIETPEEPLDPAPEEIIPAPIETPEVLEEPT